MTELIDNLENSLDEIEQLFSEKKRKYDKSDIDQKFKIYRELGGKVGEAMMAIDNLEKFFNNVTFDETRPDKSIDLDRIENLILSNHHKPSMKEIMTILKKLYNVYHITENVNVVDDIEDEIIECSSED